MTKKQNKMEKLEQIKSEIKNGLNDECFSRLGTSWSYRGLQFGYFRLMSLDDLKNDNRRAEIVKALKSKVRLLESSLNDGYKIDHHFKSKKNN